MKEKQDLKRGYEKALDEYKEFQHLKDKREYEQKGRARKTRRDVTDLKEQLTPNKNGGIDDSRHLSPRPPSENHKHSSAKRSPTAGSSDFERAEDSEDILEAHMNRNDRQKI